MPQSKSMKEINRPHSSHLFHARGRDAYRFGSMASSKGTKGIARSLLLLVIATPLRLISPL
jgi:hypothetical protein